MPKKTYYETEFYDDHIDSSAQEENVILNNTPWWAISVAMHAIVLLMIWSIVIADVVVDEKVTTTVGVDNENYVEPPNIPPPPIEEDKIDEIIEDVVDDKVSENVEEPTENPDPNKRPQEFTSHVESPYPEDGFNSSLGLGGNIGGGPGPGGGGHGIGYIKRGHPKDHGTDDNVFAALYWLRDHQNKKTGAWSADNFIEQCQTNSPSPTVMKDAKTFKREGVCSNLNGNPDTGWKMGKDGVTGLAILAFLGAGYTQEDGIFRHTVKLGLRYLLSIQTDDGCFGPKEDEHYVYNHAICTMAIVEAYGMTALLKLKSPSQLAVDYIANAQNNDPDRGWLGWRYGERTGENDGSVSGWMVLALKSAKLANLNIPQHCWDGAIKLYKDLTSDPSADVGITGVYPRTGYLTKGGPNARLKEASNFLTNPSIDAINVICNLFMGTSREDKVLKAQSRLMTSEREGYLPAIDNEDKIDYYYWYYASLAMYQMGDDFWKRWEEPLIDSLKGLQRLEDIDSCVYGSWDPIGAWGTAGGRVYATAINALTLEVYYRYEFIGANSAKK